MEFKLKAEKGYEGFNSKGVYVKNPPIFKEYYETIIASDASGIYGKPYSRSGHVDADIINSYPKEYKKFKTDLETRRDYHERVALYELIQGKPYIYEEAIEALLPIPVEKIEEVKAIEEAPQSPELKEVAPVIAKTLEVEPEVTISDLEQEQIKERKEK